mmetsp:Transcript_9889/g.20909  ORF Transcript_9889/g.20909 Transcript_9889/m.20909 type:complete len:89 (-) Transcript_9889:282-548(-)
MLQQGGADGSFVDEFRPPPSGGCGVNVSPPPFNVAPFGTSRARCERAFVAEARRPSPISELAGRSVANPPRSTCEGRGPRQKYHQGAQ